MCFFKIVTVCILSVSFHFKKKLKKELQNKRKIATQQYRIAILVESKFLKKNKKTIAIHIVSAPKYRDSIKSGGRCIVPSLVLATFLGLGTFQLYCCLWRVRELSDLIKMILKCPYYGFLKMTFHAVCNTALSE